MDEPKKITAVNLIERGALLLCVIAACYILISFYLLGGVGNVLQILQPDDYGLNRLILTLYPLVLTACFLGPLCVYYDRIIADKRRHFSSDARAVLAIATLIAGIAAFLCITLFYNASFSNPPMDVERYNIMDWLWLLAAGLSDFTGVGATYCAVHIIFHYLLLSSKLRQYILFRDPKDA